MSEITHYIYTLHLKRPAMLTEGPTPEEAEKIARHFAYLKALCNQGTVVLAGRTLTTGAESFGTVILEAASEEIARNIMNNDPAIKDDLMRGRLYPYRIALISKI